MLAARGSEAVSRRIFQLRILDFLALELDLEHNPGHRHAVRSAGRRREKGARVAVRRARGGGGALQLRVEPQAVAVFAAPAVREPLVLAAELEAAALPAPTVRLHLLGLFRT